MQKGFAQNNTIDPGFSNVGFAYVISSLNDDHLFSTQSLTIPFGIQASGS
ncbi:MAG: hypothetical protein LH473_10900 [Chitinophagales bacterium]|nr:hypothetical protein [Chitinophagales bacterium]